MAQTPFRFNDDQCRKLKEWFDQKWGGKGKCSQCGQLLMLDFDQGPCYLLTGDDRGNINHRETYPCATLICGNCGTTVLVNLVVAGLMSGHTSVERENV
jgi:hypothetical protein